jgi:ligand-binding sensor domain-containing protein
VFQLFLLLLSAAYPAAQCVQAQTRTPAQSQVIHDFWGFKEGAPEPVFAIAQTADGFLWLGGPEGLVRFDGRRLCFRIACAAGACQVDGRSARHMERAGLGHGDRADNPGVARLRQHGLIMMRMREAAQGWNSLGSSSNETTRAILIRGASGCR